ncbi:MAG: hypothetical protein VB980_02050 [Opitutales bacterium]|jgi:hypothetical protein
MNTQRDVHGHSLYSAIFILVLGATCFSGGCRHADRDKIVSKAPPHEPTNLHSVEKFPDNFKRVIVLPCHHIPEDQLLVDYIDTVFRHELAKRRVFEPVFVSRNELHRLVGKTQLTPQEKLPENLLARLLAEYAGVDGVMFLEIFNYRAYKPLALGVRGRLVDLRSGDFIWAIDETFDAGNASIISAADEFQRRNQVTNFSRHSYGSVLTSPRVFTKYVANAAFGTLPTR